MSQSEQLPAVGPDLFRSAADDVAELWLQPVPLPIPSGIAPLDRALDGGFLPESLAVLCAGTGRGKSGLVVQIALGWLAQGRSVLFIETEMSKRQTLARFLAQRMRQPWREIFNRGPQSTDELSKVAQRDLRGLYIVRWQRSQDIGQILESCPQSPSGPPLVILDQLSDLARALLLADMRIATARVTGDLKRFAEKHRTVILAVSQTARTVTADHRKRRSGRDFEGASKDAGEVEADAASLLYLDSEPCPRNGAAKAKIHVSKSRWSPCNEVVELLFHGAHGTFEPVAAEQHARDHQETLDAIKLLGCPVGVKRLAGHLKIGQANAEKRLAALQIGGLIVRSEHGISLAVTGDSACR